MFCTSEYSHVFFRSCCYINVTNRFSESFSCNTVITEKTTVAVGPISSTVQGENTVQNDTTGQDSATVLSSPETVDIIAATGPSTVNILREGIGTTGDRVAAIAAMIGIQIAAAVAAVEAVHHG